MASDLSVALYTQSSEPSGVGAHMVALAKALGRSRRLSMAFTTGERTRPFREQARVLGLEVTALPVSSRKRPPRRALLQAWLRRRRPDVLHIHAGISWEALDVPALARAEGVPVVVRTEHLPRLMPDDDPTAPVRHAAMCGELDALICVSRSVAATYEAAGAPASLLRVALNGVEPFAPVGRADARSALGVAGDRPTFLTIGRFTDQKGWWQWLDCVEAARAQRSDVLFLAAGEGPILRWIRQAAERRGLLDSVRFLGRRGDVSTLMGAADALVMPSWFEGHPLVVLEAMFAGLPVAAFDSPGVNEAVTDGGTGLLVGRGNSGALTEAALRLHGDKALASRLTRAARADAERRFRAEHMAERTLAIYREALGASREAA